VPAIPAGALWPDADGRIVATASESGIVPDRHAMRNPWEVRIHPKVARPDSIFVCGGVISGGQAAPVAFVNGRIATRGDVFDGFVVEAVATSAVVLTQNGTMYVLPLGRRTAISSEGP
jgi:hypothetical protein